MKDIQVYTALDAKVKPAERLDILVLSTEGKADMQTFNDLELLKEAYRGKKVAALVDRMFNQDHTLADTLIRRVRMVGIENPQNEGGKASMIAVTFSGLSTSEELEAQTTYYAKLGSKVVVPITTGEAAPEDEAEFAALFEIGRAHV